MAVSIVCTEELLILRMDHRHGRHLLGRPENAMFIGLVTIILIAVIVGLILSLRGR
jgi:hypothetical protein